MGTPAKRASTKSVTAQGTLAKGTPAGHTSRGAPVGIAPPTPHSPEAKCSLLPLPAVKGCGMEAGGACTRRALAQGVPAMGAPCRGVRPRALVQLCVGELRQVDLRGGHSAITRGINPEPETQEAAG